MVDIARANVLLEADNARLQRDLDRANGRIKKFQGQAKRATEQTARAVTAGIARPLLALTAGFSSAALVRGIIQSADSYQLLQGRLKLVTSSSEELAQVNQELFSVAQRTRAPLEGVADLYIRLAGVSKELGVGQQDLIKFTEGVGNALTLSGTSAEGASGALLQLSQAIGGGIVRAEEFNSILEGAPVIVQTVAKNLDAAGGSVAKLRTLINSGEVTSREFFDAFQQGSEQLGIDAQSIPRTVGQALTQLRNEFSRSLGTASTSPLIAAIDQLRENVKDPEFQRQLVQTANNIVTVVSALASAGASAVGGINAALDALANKKRNDELADLANRVTVLKREISERENAGGILEVFGRDPNAELQGLRTELDKTSNSLKEYVNNAAAAAVPRVKPLEVQDVPIPFRPGMAPADQMIPFRPGRGPKTGEAATPPAEQSNTVNTPRAAKQAVDEWASSLEAAASIQAEVERMDQQRNALLDEARSLYESTRTPMEEFQARQARIDELWKAGVLSVDTYQRAIKQAEDALASQAVKAEETTEKLSVYAEQAARNMQDAFADFLFDPFSKGLDGMLADFANILQRMAAEAAAAQIFESLGFGGSGGGGGGDLLGSLIGSAVGFFSGGVSPTGTREAFNISSMDSGGRGVAGEPYFIGTGAQPELFVPDRAGTFVPRDEWMGAGNTTININIPVSAPTGSVGRQTLDQIGSAALSGASRARGRNR